MIGSVLSSGLEEKYLCGATFLLEVRYLVIPLQTDCLVFV